MSNIGSYTNRSFSENQKFLVLDPSTGTTSLVLGSDLVSYITPQLDSVIAESTRVAAENTDYEVGKIIQTSGATSPGDNFAAVYLVVEGGTGDFPMINGNDLLVIRGDEFLREQLISEDAGEGASLVSMEGGPTVEDFLALDRIRPVESYGGIANDSSVSAKSANEAALAAAEADNYQPFFGPGNDYYVSAGYNPWQHRFAAGRDVSLFIDVTEYNISNAIWGLYRIDDFSAGTNDYITLRNARDDIVIARIGSGDNASASHVFQLPLDIRRDSHSMISSPGTEGGNSDILLRRNNGEDLIYLLNRTGGITPGFDILFNTTPAPDFNFDTAMRVPTETIDQPIEFPALDVRFQRAASFKKRSGGNIEIRIAPLSDSVEIREKETGTVLGEFTKDYTELAGVKFHALETTPSANGSFKWSTTLADSALTTPFTKTVKAATASTEAWIATLTVAGATSGGGKGVKQTRYVYDGSTLTATDIVNTLPVQIVGEVRQNATESDQLDVYAEYTGGLGGGVRITLNLDVVGALR